MTAKCSTALLAVALAGCGAPEPAGQVQPLMDDVHYPDVLTEGRAVELPPSFSGNRFLRGWFPWRTQETQVFVPHADGAVIEIVNISREARALSLEALLLGESGDFNAQAEVAGVELDPVPVGESIKVSLPADLPLGRLPVRLTFPKVPDPVMLSASLDQALPPGEVSIASQRIVQAANSLVDFTRPVEPGATLVGRFEPPTDPREGQRFAILLDREDHESEVLFEWTNNWLDRIRGPQSISEPLPENSEFLRIRLLAEGSGPAGTWHGLGLVGSAPPPQEPPEVSLPAPPRLVLLYVLDALRGDYVDLTEGPDNPTPTLARLAAEGVVFNRHQSVAPNTIPSTKSLFTGQTFLARGHWKLSAEAPETLAEAFASAGYRTAAFSGNGYISDAYGTSRGFEHLADEVVFRDHTGRPDAYNDNAARVQKSALDWLDDLDEDERAFVYLHTIHPHNPYDPPTPMQERFTADIDSEIEASTRNLLDIKHNRVDVTASDKDRIAGLYAGALAYNDDQIALLLDELSRRYPQEEILLIVTSDHGEELFDHDGVLHGYTLYQEQLDIPLIFWWPGRLQPQRIDGATDNVDLHESLRALIGVEASGIGEGRPFWSMIGSERPAPQERELRFAAASSVKGGIFMAQSARYKLILAPRVGMTFGMGEGRGRGRDPEYVFDLIADPQEMINLAGSRILEVDWMRSRLTAWIERGKFLEMDEEEPVLDEETEARLRALGYLE